MSIPQRPSHAMVWPPTLQDYSEWVSVVANRIKNITGDIHEVRPKITASGNYQARAHMNTFVSPNWGVSDGPNNPIFRSSSSSGHQHLLSILPVEIFKTYSSVLTYVKICCLQRSGLYFWVFGGREYILDVFFDLSKGFRLQRPWFLDGTLGAGGVRGLSNVWLGNKSKCLWVEECGTKWIKVNSAVSMVTWGQ